MAPLAAGALLALQAWLLAGVLDAALVHGANRGQLLRPIAAIGLLILLRAALAWLAERAGARAAETIKHRVRLALFGCFLRAGPQWTRQQVSGELASALVEQTEVPWLEPVPTSMVTDPHDPASIVDDRAGVRLALIAALQHLPPRQRAVLILREVLRWSAAEVAEALETTTASVNSALQRARATLDAAGLTEADVVEPTDPAQRELLDRYARAMELKDIAAIVSLCAQEAVWEMPPFVGWYQGAETIGLLIDVNCPAGPGELRMVPTTANGQAAFGMYYLTDDGTYRPFQLQVLELRGGEVAHVSAFFDHSLFTLFGLPDHLDGGTPLYSPTP